ncbi:crocetin glucosyltransferase, chloroplastic-like [Neltuma alba]|uniref:crocetin glucosyltransferase, chloroplastic-like n=1 Tax=Neltuma alba TaxID=207710 RepID=UPI0010A49957|nr:crocetin glucosyltransferase, chloroplastic-like [Prosopis alba]
MAQTQQHFLVLGFPVQSHLNPTLQFSKRLIGMGARVTLLITVSMYRRIIQKPIIDGLTIASYSDGYDDGFTDSTSNAKVDLYLSEFKRLGKQALTNLVASKSNEGHPFAAVIYSLYLSWAAEVARSLHVPSAFLWVQPATVLDIYYYYLRGYTDYIDGESKDPEGEIKLPGLPLMKTKDLPSFLLPSNIYSFAIPLMDEHFRELDLEVKPRVLVNSFEALESEAIRAVSKMNMIPVGPLIPSAFLGGKDPSDTSFGLDIFSRSSGYAEWLDSQPERSVVYVSFGSLSSLPERQMREIACALLDSGRPFLWVIRDFEKQKTSEEEEEEEEEWGWRKGLEEKGRIVKWCNQVEVLSHRAVGCFVTHCGWNSSIESLVSGVPMVAFPLWTDQMTNAKLIEDVWKTGTRVKVNEEGVAESDEIRRCLDVVLGEGAKAVEMRNEAEKWKDLAKEAVKEGGSSHQNLRAFLNEFAGC